MPSNHKDRNDQGTAAPAASPDNGPSVGNTRQLLRAIHKDAAPRHDRLYDEICRRNPGKEHDPSELIECSVKLSPRGFFGQRHGGSLAWSPDDRGALAEAAGRAAPSDQLQQALTLPRSDRTDSPDSRDASSDPASAASSGPAEEVPPRLAALQGWLQRTARFFSAVAYDYDAKLYKLYLFKHHPIHYFEELDLLGRAGDLPTLAYIRSAEVPFDDPQGWREALYFKLRFLDPAAGMTDAGSLGARRKLADILAPDYRPHDLLSPRLLAALPNRAVLVDSLSALLADVQLVNDPVIKLTPPSLPSEATPEQSRKAWAELDYGVNLNLLDPQRIRFVQEQEATLLQIAEALGCRGPAKAWLQQIEPYDCFLSYLGVGPDSVTLYYRSTTLHRRKPAPHFRRGRGAGERRSDPPGPG